jgi:phospholipid/cholesterol/gamma-HCH transport system substrate-binding protein
MRTPISRIEKWSALFIVAALVVLGAVLIFPRLMSGRLFHLYYLQVASDDGIGLSVGDQVEIQGIQVGEVSRFQLDEASNVLIDCKIFGQFRDRITSGTKVVLAPPSFIGSPVVKILPGKGRDLLPSGTVLRAAKETSLMGTIGGISGQIAPLLTEIQGRVKQASGTLEALQGVLEALNRGEGTAGKLIRDQDLYASLLRVTNRVDHTIEGLDPIRARLEEFTAALPALREDLVASSAKLRASLDHLEEGLRKFPAMAADATSSLAESKRIVESLKRNAIIRMNLPREAETETMTPASRREPPSQP